MNSSATLWGDIDGTTRSTGTRVGIARLSREGGGAHGGKDVDGPVA